VGAGGGVVRLKTSAAWGGGAYVLVSVIQPRDPVSTPVPRRALGLVYVPLDPGSRRLSVDLDVPAKLSSKAPVVVPVHVRGLGLGQRARVTVAAVDEGILALTHFESPDPTGWYFGKRALGVDYRDDYGRILDANLGAPANVAFGGDELGGQGLTVTPTRTVALWSGVVRTGADGRVRVRLPPGDFNGQLRIMAVAWTDTAVGGASAALTVREPVVAELDLPRFLSPGDRPIATLELHNLEGRPGSYEARTVDEAGLSAPFSRIIPLGVGQRLTTPIPFAAPGQAGLARIGLAVTGPGFATTRRYDIQTRLGWGAQTRVATGLQRPGERFTPPASLLSGLAAGDVDMRVSYSPFRGFDPAGVALSLSHYPYACSEQLVSTAYAGLFSGATSGAPEGLRTVSDAVGQLIDRQSLDGAFGLWRVGDGEADPWLGAYVVDFLLEARATPAGPAPDAVERALSAMRQISRPEGFAAVSYRMTYSGVWALADPATARAATARLRSRASAYALYVLAKAGQGDLPRLRWRHDSQLATERSPLALAQIGAGLALMGDHARARDSLRQAMAALGYKDPDDDYQSPLRDLAGVIALAYEAGEPDLARPLQDRLPGLMRDPDSLNTQEQAWLLRAARAMFRAAGPVHIDAIGAARASGAGSSTWSVARLADAAFVNRGAGPIWRTVTVRGTPLRPPPATADGLGLARRVMSLSGAPVNLAAIRQGERVIVRLAGDSRQGRASTLVVDDALPAGFEIETVLGPQDGATSGRPGPFAFLGVLTQPSLQQSRYDRYIAALTVPGHKAFTLAYVARAVTPGDFFLPGATARDMYHPAVGARTASGRLIVTPAG
jgi:uncharacterized protein YfaS (alpha-2-macroglobulin family)